MLESLNLRMQDLFFWGVNMLISALASFLNFVSGLLPAFDVPSLLPDFGQFEVLSALNWVFPVSLGVQCVNAVVSSITLYFTVGMLLRWGKVTN